MTIARAGVVLLFAVLLASAAQAASALRGVEVQQSGEGYTIDATALAPVPPALAWEVVTDFDHISRFAPNVRESRVVQRDGNRVTFEQRGVVRFGALNFSYASERIVEMSPPTSLHSVQTKGSMRRQESVTTLSAEGSGTRIDYHLELVPGPFLAPLLSKSLLVHEVEEQFNAAVDEMVRRRR